MASDIQPSKSQLLHLRDQLGQCTADAMKEMIENSEKAYTSYSTDMKSLDKGLWYPHEYIVALKTHNQMKRLEFMKDKGYLLSGYLSAKYFVPLYDGSLQRDWSFVIKDNVLPSEALKSAMIGMSISGCGTVCQIARYKALLDVLGEAKFNRLFSKPHGTPMELSYNNKEENQPMKYFVDFDSEAKRLHKTDVNKRTVKVGQVVSINGVPAYALKHPMGLESNFNAVCIDATPGNQRYVALGLRSAGETEAEIAKRMVDAYNADPADDLERVPSKLIPQVKNDLELLETASFKNDKVDDKAPLKVVQGFDPFSPQDFKVELVHRIVQAPLEQVSMAFVRSFVNKAQVAYI